MASSSARYRVTQPLGSPPTLRTGYVRVLVYCNSCRHQADADRYALVESGRGDVPLTELPFRCSQCGSDRTDFVVTSLDRFCHVSRRLPLVARPKSSDYAICMMPIAMRACWRK